MKRRLLLWGLALLVVIAVATPFLFAVPAMPDRGTGLPSTRVTRGPLKLTVYATGEIRAGRTATLVVPPAGGMLRLVTMLSTGTHVKAGDVVFEIDPADQEFALEQAKSEMAEAEQQIVKTRADSAVQPDRPCVPRESSLMVVVTCLSMWKADNTGGPSDTAKEGDGGAPASRSVRAPSG